jgi:hypothetical protein
VSLGLVRGGSVLLIAAAVVVGGCGGTLQTATGVVISVQARSLTEVDGFTLRTPDGQLLEFTAGPIAFDQTSFPPQHLREHQATSQPVKVTYRFEGSTRVATKLEDAPAPPG